MSKSAYAEVRDERAVPVALKVVAWLFIIGGIVAGIEMVVNLLRGTIGVKFGVLGIFIGRGLLRLDDKWRVIALVVVVVKILGTLIVLVMMLGSGASAKYEVFGFKVGEASDVAAAVFSCAFMAFFLWELLVLTREDVKGLFEFDMKRAVEERERKRARTEAGSGLNGE